MQFLIKLFFCELRNFPTRVIPWKSLVTRSHAHKLTEVPSALQTRHATILGNDYDYGVAKLHVLISWQNNIIDSLLFLYRILRFSAQKYLTTWTSLVLQEAAVLIFYCLFLNFQNKYYYFLKVTHLKTPYYSTPWTWNSISPEEQYELTLVLLYWILKDLLQIILV